MAWLERSPDQVQRFIPLPQTQRVLKINEVQTVSLELFDAADEGLVIGQAWGRLQLGHISVKTYDTCQTNFPPPHML